MQTFITKPLQNQEFKNLVESLNLQLDSVNGPWIAGGCVRRLWYDQPWNTVDVDIFYQNNHQFEKNAGKLKALHVQFYNSIIDNTPSNILDDIDIFTKKLGDQSLDGLHAVPYETNNATTYKIKINNKIYKIQSIKRSWHKSSTEMLNEFDFTVCNFFTDGINLFATADAINDCNNQQLNFNQNVSRKLNAGRVIKYSLYGFNPSIEIMKELFRQKNNNEIAFGDIYD